MKAKFIFLTFIVLTTISNACSQTTAVSEKLNVQTANRQKTTPIQDDKLPFVIRGSIGFVTDRQKPSGSIGVDRAEAIANADAGITIKLPPIETTIKMDAINCAGYLATAEVSFLGFDQQPAWKVEFLSETLVPDIIERMKKCEPYYEDKLPVASLFFVAPADEKRKQFKMENAPDWKEFLATLPAEWKKSAKLDEKSLKKRKEPVENSVGWADLDGDGRIDILELDQDTLSYGITIPFINGKWEKIWQSQRNEKEYEP